MILVLERVVPHYTPSVDVVITQIQCFLYELFPIYIIIHNHGYIQGDLTFFTEYFFHAKLQERSPSDC